MSSGGNIENITWSVMAKQTTQAKKVYSLDRSCNDLIGSYTAVRFFLYLSTKYKGFGAKLGPRGKSRSLQGLLESTKKNGGSHAFFRDN